MQFKSFAEFIEMGGYGFYVWLAFGFTLVVFGLLTVLSLRKQKQLLAEVQQMLNREQRIEQAKHAGESDLL